MINDDNKVWIKEFTQFVEAEPILPPTKLSDEILNHVKNDLNPHVWMVFSKVAFIQTVVGFITLLFCPQFGLSLTGVHGIMHFFMQFGEAVCMFSCGVLFAGSSLLVSALLLKPEEIQVLKRKKTLQIGLLSLLTIGAFHCLGAEVFEFLTFAWMIGSILGGVASLELGWKTRQWMRTRIIYG